MCCQETKKLDLPAEVIEALARYRRLLGERGWDWGDEQLPDFFRWARFSLLGPVFEAVAATGDWAKAIRSVIGDDVRPGISPRACRRSGTPITGRSSTATTLRFPCRPSRCTWSAPGASSSSERSSTCSRPRARRASSSATRKGCSTRRPKAGTAATCTST